MSIDFAQLAADTTVSTDPEFPTVHATRRQAADPALVQLVTEARDGKRRDLPGRLSTTPYEGRKAAHEAQTVIDALQRAARQVGVKLRVRRFDADATSVRVTFAVVEPEAPATSTTATTTARGKSGK